MLCCDVWSVDSSARREHTRLLCTCAPLLNAIRDPFTTFSALHMRLAPLGSKEEGVGEKQTSGVLATAEREELYYSVQELQHLHERKAVL